MAPKFIAYHLPNVLLFVGSRPITRSTTAKRRRPTPDPLTNKSKYSHISAAHLSPSPAHLVEDLQSRLQNSADSSYKLWIERYLKNEIQCRGLRLSAVEKSVKEWTRAHELFAKEQPPSNTSLDEQLLSALFKSSYGEDKLAATLYAQNVMRPSGRLGPNSLDLFEQFFADDLVYPWSTVDSLCKRVFAKMIQDNEEVVSSRISSWRTAKNLWKARCSVVSLVPHAKYERFRSIIWANCKVVVLRPERFAKTSVGWILREVAKHDEDFTLRFVTEFKDHMSLEAARNATKWCAEEAKKRCIQLIKESKVHSPKKR